MSVDPLQFKYPHYTPFQYAGNKPISYIDLDGLEDEKPELLKNVDYVGILAKKVEEIQNTTDYSTDETIEASAELVSMKISQAIKNKALDIEWNNKQTGRKVDNYGQERQSPRKSIKTGEHIDVGGNSSRGKYTTRGMGYETRDVKIRKLISNSISEFAGPLIDLIDLVKVLNQSQNVFEAINPYSFVVEQRIFDLDNEMLQFAINQGYKDVKNLFNNCRSCDDMLEGLALINVTLEELNDIALNKITNINQLEVINRNDSLGYATLIKVDKNQITFIAGFSTTTPK